MDNHKRPYTAIDHVMTNHERDKKAHSVANEKLKKIALEYIHRVMHYLKRRAPADHPYFMEMKETQKTTYLEVMNTAKQQTLCMNNFCIYMPCRHIKMVLRNNVLKVLFVQTDADLNHIKTNFSYELDFQTDTQEDPMDNRLLTLLNRIEGYLLGRPKGLNSISKYLTEMSEILNEVQRSNTPDNNLIELRSLIDNNLIDCQSLINKTMSYVNLFV